MNFNWRRAFIIFVSICSIPVSVFASSKKTKALKAYKRFLANNESTFVASPGLKNIEIIQTYSEFLVVDLNNDKVPELVTFHPDGYKDGYVYFFSYKNKVKRLQVKKSSHFNSNGYGVHAPTYTSPTFWSGLTAYSCSKNHFHLNLRNGAGHTEWIFTMKKGRVVLKAVLADSSDLPKNGTIKYYINDKKVSSAKYNSFVRNCKVKKSFESNNAAKRKKLK